MERKRHTVTKQEDKKWQQTVNDVKSFNRTIDGATKKLEESLGPKAIQNVFDGANKLIKKKVGNILHSQDGKLAELKESFANDAVVKWVKGAVGTIDKVGKKVTKKALRAYNAVQQEANFIQAKADVAKNTVLADLNVIESGIIKATTASTGHQVGTEFAGMKFGAQTSLTFNPATCFDVAKAIKDILKIIAFLKKLVGKLKKIGLPGVNQLLKQLDQMGKFKIPCVDISVSASAQVAALEEGVDGTNATTPKDPDPNTWTLVPPEDPVV